MAQIFNIYFKYEELTYSAMVSVRKTPFFLEYTLHNLPDNILDQLPGNRIISREKQELIFQLAGAVAPNELMSEIMKAVSEHSQVHH
jgi:hypothetical protein